MSKVRTRAFTVPKGSRFVCMPLDGAGPFVAHEGETVMVLAAESWESAMRTAIEKLIKPESDE